MAMATVSVAAPVRATAGSKAAKPAFMGRAAAGSKASLSDAFCAMSLATPARKQANRSLSICGEYAFGATAVSERSGRRYPDREGTALFSGIGNPTPCSAVEPRGTGGEEREWDGWTSMDRVESTAHARASNHHDAVVPSLPFPLRIVHHRSPRVAPSARRPSPISYPLHQPSTDLFFPNPPTAAAATTSVNQVGFVTPPSTGAAAWDAIVEVGGSQQFVTEGRYYECHSLKGVEPGSKIAFERVLATKAGDAPTFGEPYVAGARVEATVLENFKDKKLIVLKYRRKKHYKRKNGHRQPMTRFLVTKVVKP